MQGRLGEGLIGGSRKRRTHLIPRHLPVLWVLERSRLPPAKACLLWPRVDSEGVEAVVRVSDCPPFDLTSGGYEKVGRLKGLVRVDRIAVLLLHRRVDRDVISRLAVASADDLIEASEEDTRTRV